MEEALRTPQTPGLRCSASPRGPRRTSTMTSATTSASAKVTNSGNGGVSVSVAPAAPRVGDTVTCTGIATDPDGDPDGDPPTLTYAWQDGSTGATYTVAAAGASGSEGGGPGASAPRRGPEPGVRGQHPRPAVAVPGLSPPSPLRSPR